VLVAAGSSRFGMRACLSGTAVIYLCCAVLLATAAGRVADKNRHDGCSTVAR
jgi:hypothetical protein